MTVPKGVGAGIVGGVPGGVQRAEIMPYLASAVPVLPPPPEGAEDRKIVQTATMDLIVTSPAQAAEEIRKITKRLGGYLENSKISGSPNAFAASIAIRVPSARFDEAHAEIRKLALRIDEDRVAAQDTTKQYVDLNARMHNLRAEEAQYRAILKQAKTVKDTPDVAKSRARLEVMSSSNRLNSICCPDRLRP